MTSSDSSRLAKQITSSDKKLVYFLLITQLSGHFDIGLSHDWPLGIYHHGNKAQLLRKKTYFADEVYITYITWLTCDQISILFNRYLRTHLAVLLPWRYCSTFSRPTGSRLISMWSLQLSTVTTRVALSPNSWLWTSVFLVEDFCRCTFYTLTPFPYSPPHSTCIMWPLKVGSLVIPQSGCADYRCKICT